MSRSNEEWIAKNDDQAVPLRVKVRVFERYEGRCYLSGRKIQAGEPWEVEHVIALCNGGEHRENNLAPALKAPHKAKTADDLKLKSKIARTRAKHLGQWPRGQKIASRGFPKRGGVSATPQSAGSGRCMNQNKGSDQ